MQVLWAVLVDLWEFFTGCFRIKNTKEAWPVETSPLLIADRKPKLVLENKPPQTLLEASSAVETTAEVVSSSLGTAYVVVDKARAFQNPLWAFDTVSSVFDYAHPVTVLGYEGRFARVLDEAGSLFILKDELTTNKKDIFPNLDLGGVYLAATNETKKLRKIIRDEFFTAESYLPLLGVEYVTYRLGVNSIHIAWPETRPRPAGSWWEILKGGLGITIRVTPKTGSIMEYKNEDGLGFVCYVEAVSPEDTVTISSVGRQVEGQYLVEKLSKEEWQALQPLWIQVQ
jgi:hypothetical protein